MRNVQRVHAPIGSGVYVHRRGRFSEVEHYKCTPGEPSRSTEIDLPGRVSREGQVHRKRARNRRKRTCVRACASVYRYLGRNGVTEVCRATEFYKH